MSNINEETLAEKLNVSGQFMKADALALTALRRAIITGAFAPNEAIDEEMVARQLGISRMPVRQAMGVLESEGLVKRVYRRGVTVTALTPEEVREIYHIRANLESLAVRHAVPHYTDEHLEHVGSVLDQLEEREDDILAFSELNAQFHALLYEPSGWSRLCSLIDSLRANVSRYIVISHERIVKFTHRRATHRRIFTACMNRASEEAQSLVAEHVFDAMETLLKHMDSDAPADTEQ